MEKDEKINYKTIEAKVLSVKGSTSEIYNTGRIRIGGRGSGTFTGHASNLELEIESDTPIQVLEFDGSWPIEAGDRIRATINMVHVSCYPIPNSPIEIKPRDNFYEKEHPIKIEKIRDGKVVAEYTNSLKY